MDDHAFVVARHSEPPSDSISQIDVVVRYGQKESRLHIPLAPPLGADQDRRAATAQELRDLGTALLRIADRPSAIYDRDPRQK